MSTDELKAQGKCCACEAELKHSIHLNMVQLQRQASWKFPVWGHILNGQQNMALAFICDPCYDSGEPTIKFAVEQDDNGIKYHPIEKLELLN